jgi:hypothetical protein
MVGMRNDIVSVLRQLEERLFEPRVRRDPRAMAGLLAEEFIEVGRNGETYTKPRMIAALQSEALYERSLTDFDTREVAPHLCLVTYHHVRRDPRTGRERHSRRSSIWKQSGNTWQMVFHRGQAI